MPKKTTRRDFLKTLGIASISAAAMPRSSVIAGKSPKKSIPSKPNVVFIMADDMGWGDVEAYNPESLIPTPNINRLAREGLSFLDAHSGGALCSPTRYGIMTGRFYWRTHKKHSLVMPYDPPVIPPERLTWGRLMRECGYGTGYIGKWHLGLWYPSKTLKGFQRQYTINENEIDFGKAIVGGPCDLGFDYFFGTAGCSTSDAPYCFIRNNHWVGTPSIPTPADMNKQPGVYPGLMAPDWDQEKVDMNLNEEAVGFIANHMRKTPEKPFFLYYALSAPHIPWINPEFIRGTSKEGPRGDMNALVDWCVGKIRKALETHDILDDTILIFTSDNGPRKGANGQKSAGSFRGYKNSAYEGGHRIPFIIRWPGIVKADSRSDIPICLNDMMATFAELLNYKLPDNAAEDSFNIMPAILAESTTSLQRPALITDTGAHVSELGNFSIRHDKWKLIEMNPKPSNKRKKAEYELYDMGKDPYETENLADVHTQKVEEMKRLLSVCKQRGLRFVGESHAHTSITKRQ